MRRTSCQVRHSNLTILCNLIIISGPATDLGIRATLIEQHSPPEILVHGLVTPEDVEKLFEMYVITINPLACGLRLPVD
jgi:hypothetical protein